MILWILAWLHGCCPMPSTFCQLRKLYGGNVRLLVCSAIAQFWSNLWTRKSLWTIKPWLHSLTLINGAFVTLALKSFKKFWKVLSNERGEWNRSRASSVLVGFGELRDMNASKKSSRSLYGSRFFSSAIVFLTTVKALWKGVYPTGERSETIWGTMPIYCFGKLWVK